MFILCGVFAFMVGMAIGSWLATEYERARQHEHHAYWYFRTRDAEEALRRLRIASKHKRRRRSARCRREYAKFVNMKDRQ